MITRALIVITGAIALLCTVASHARAQDNNPFSGARSIEVTMHRVSTAHKVNKNGHKSRVSASESTTSLPKGEVAETCIASQYGIGDGYNGKRTASGAIFNTYTLTAAHRTRRFGSIVMVTNLGNGRAVSVRIVDRGPFVRGRCIDLSRAAANAIGMGGTARVSVE